MSTEIPRVGRNENCPCGSGKKYKKCHGGASHANVVAEIAKIGPQWFERRVTELLSGASEDRPVLAQCEIFDHQERLDQAGSEGKDKRERELLENLKLGLSQSALEPFEVTEVRRGYGLSLKGALSGRRFYVDSAEVAERLEPMEWLLGRVVLFGQRAYLLNDWSKVPFRRRKQLRAALLAAYEPEAESPAESPAEGAEAADSAEASAPKPVPTTWLRERGPWVLSTYDEVTSA